MSTIMSPGVQSMYPGAISPNQPWNYDPTSQGFNDRNYAPKGSYDRQPANLYEQIQNIKSPGSYLKQPLAPGATPAAGTGLGGAPGTGTGTGSLYPTQAQLGNYKPNIPNGTLSGNAIATAQNALQPRSTQVPTVPPVPVSGDQHNTLNTMLGDSLRAGTASNLNDLTRNAAFQQGQRDLAHQTAYAGAHTGGLANLVNRQTLESNNQIQQQSMHAQHALGDALMATIPTYGYGSSGPGVISPGQPWFYDQGQTSFNANNYAPKGSYAMPGQQQAAPKPAAGAGAPMTWNGQGWQQGQAAGGARPPVTGGTGTPTAGGNTTITTDITPKPIYTPNMTQHAVNQAVAENTPDLRFAMKSAYRPGVSRSAGTEAAAMPQVAESMLAQRQQASSIPLLDEIANQTHLQAGQVTSVNQSQDIANLMNQLYGTRLNQQQFPLQVGTQLIGQLMGGGSGGGLLGGLLG